MAKMILRRRKTYRIYKLQKVLFSISIFLFQSNSQASTLWGTNKGCGICVYNISHKLYYFLRNWNFYIQSQFSVSKNVWIFLIFFHINLGPHFLITSILELLLYLLKWRPSFVNTTLQISKNHFATFDFLVKMKLVPNVVHINVTTLIWLLRA